MSLRARLIVAMAVVAVVLVLAAIAITTTTESHLLGQLDDRLQEVAVRAAGLRRPGPRPGGDFRDDGPVSSFYVGYVNHTGAIERPTTRRCRRTGTSPTRSIPSNDIANLAPGEHAYFSVSSDGGPRYRVLAARPADAATSRDRRRAPTRNDVDDAIRRLGDGGGLDDRRDRRGARARHLVGDPARRPPDQADDRDRDRASRAATSRHRVSRGTTGTEAGELGVALNQMLGRIEEAFDERTRSEDRLRRFVADASHELRTPVTTIRGYAELYRAGGLDDERRAARGDATHRAGGDPHGSLVDDLLLLARLDQGRPLERAPVRPRKCSSRTRCATRARSIHDREITASIEHRATVLGDDGRLRQVVGNLVRNALVHTPDGTPVHVRVDRTTDGSRCSKCTTTAPACPDEVAAQAFERFYRADPSRVAQPRRQRARPRDRRGDRATRTAAPSCSTPDPGAAPPCASSSPSRPTATRPPRHDATALHAYIAVRRSRPRCAMIGRGGNRGCISARVATRRRARSAWPCSCRVRARRPRVPRRPTRRKVVTTARPVRCAPRTTSSAT